VLLDAALVGCGPAQKNEDFVPTEDAARAALEAYLKAWAAGDKSPTVPGTSPAVQVVDDYRGKGRTLTEYTVLGPVPADAPRCFAVRLTLGNPREEVRERYVVVGLDPLWVWRYDDYEMIVHWEHRMPTEKDKKAAPTAKR